MVQLLFLEFNEISFERVAYYCDQGELPNLGELIERAGWSTTRSEQAYEHLEPWIQWVTAHTGLTFAEHGVFRLGDIVNRDLRQVWEQLEERGLKVAAMCPMNAKHRLRDPAFFVPDPWTPTAVTARPLLRRMSAAISQAVNDNAQGRLTLASAAALVTGFAAYARPANYARYAALLAGAHGRPWHKAMFLDLLLADVFVRETRRTHPNFATLFLNAGAHIQHHYLFSSASYRGPNRNPAWYAPADADPVLDVYRMYDSIFATVRRVFPTSRIMVATGLHQDPYAELKYYWRLKHHESFLQQIAVPFVAVEPRMSRDFLIKCADEKQAAIAAERLRTAVAADGTALFEVDNRGHDIFVMLVYPAAIERDFTFSIGATAYRNLHDNVAFVALKNGEHNGAGYFLDTGAPKGSVPAEFPLTEIPRRIMEALNVDRPAGQTT